MKASNWLNKLGATIALMLLGLLATTTVSAQQISNYLENKLLDHVLRAQSFTAPTTLCGALLTAAPTDASTGATITEASYTGYARGQLNPSASNWKGTGGETSGASAGTAGQIKNASVITFGTAATSGPTVVTHMAWLDSCTIGAGNVLWYGPLTNSKTINNGDPAPTLPVDAAVLGLD